MLSLRRARNNAQHGPRLTGKEFVGAGLLYDVQLVRADQLLDRSKAKPREVGYLIDSDTMKIQIAVGAKAKITPGLREIIEISMAAGHNQADNYYSGRNEEPNHKRRYSADHRRLDAVP